MKHFLAVIAAVGVIVLSASANATIISWSAALNGANEVPANASPGTGLGSGTYDTVTDIISWFITFTGLTGTTVSGAHFHQAPVGVNGPIRVNIGAISGLASPMSGSNDGSIICGLACDPLTAAEESDFLAGNFYINIHSLPSFAGGEIRGQVVIQAVPEPGTIGLLALGLGAGLVSLRRRRT